MAIGCGDDDVATLPSKDDTNDSPSPDGGADAGTLGGAILVAGLVQGIDSYSLYVAALPEVPNGEINYDEFREFSAGDSYVYTSGGAVFVWERRIAADAKVLGERGA